MRTNPTTLFGFIGRKGSGKDTAAEMMSEIFNEFKDPGTISAFFAFADPLKNMANSTLGISGDEAEYLKRHPSIKVANHLDIRSYYNQYGDVLKARFGKMVFTDMTIKRISEVKDALNPDSIMITDVRFPMEAGALKKYGVDNGVEVILIKMINTKLPSLNPDEHETEYLTEEMRGDYDVIAENPQEIKEQLKEIYAKL